MKHAATVASNLLRAELLLRAARPRSQCTSWSCAGAIGSRTSILLQRTGNHDRSRIASGCRQPFSTVSASLAKHRKGATRPAGRQVKEQHVQRPVEALTWRDYDPEGGLPLTNGDLSQRKVAEIFGPGVNGDSGNWILRLMNYRRKSGTLIDVGITFPAEMGITGEAAFKALTYLRSVDEFDENEAGAAWAEGEAQKLEAMYIQRAENVGLYKKTSEEAEEEISDQGTEFGRSRYGDSTLVAVRKAGEQRFKEQEEREREEREERERQEQEAVAQARIQHRQQVEIEARDYAQTVAGVPIQGISRLTTEPFKAPGNTASNASQSLGLAQPVAKAWLQPVERKPWVQYYEEQASIIKDNHIPQMSLLRRLGPSALVLLCVLGFSVFLHENYTPPPRSARVFPDVPPAVATAGTILALNLAVFLAWRLPFLWRAMNKYFLCVPGYPYAIGVLTAPFSHQSFLHLFINTVTFWPFAMYLHEDVGRGTFVAIYLASGSFGAFSSLAVNALRARWLHYSLGSSTAVLGTLAAACLLRGNNDVKILGYDTPVTGLMLLGFFGGLEFFAWFSRWSPLVDFTGHLFGFAAGIVAALLVRREAGQGAMKRVEAGKQASGKETRVNDGLGSV